MLYGLRVQWAEFWKRHSHTRWRFALSAWATRGWTRRVPVDIAGQEILTRVVTSFNLKGASKKLDHRLFIHPKDSISVSRREWIPAWLAKLHAKATIQRLPKLYKGLAFVPTACVRETNATVTDTRDVFVGHADIALGFPEQTQGVPFPPALAKLRDDRAKEIVKAVTFIEDPNPRSVFWRPRPNATGAQS